MAKSNRTLSILASVLLTGSVALALLPALSAQPAITPMALSAALAPTSDDDCIEACLDAFNATVAEIRVDTNDCLEAAKAGADIANELCSQLPLDQQDLCYALVQAALAADLAACRASQVSQGEEALAELDECLAGC